MAVCVINATLDTDTGLLVRACTVHCCYEPCEFSDGPASETPLETTDEDGLFTGLMFWTQKTRKQRPLVMHHGSWLDEQDHVGRECWCRPDFYPAVEVAS